MSNSAFNMSKCGSGGGSGSSCSSSGWAEIQSTDGNDITVVSTDKLRQALREIYLEDKQDHITQVADIVNLVYDCPKEGDAVFYNSSKGGYDLASAEIDNSNYFKDPEHLIESLAIVEKVSVTCQDGQDVPSEGYTAKVVFFGKITFSEDTTDLDPGMVYYLADSYARINAEASKFIGSNAVHSMYEPTISKPLFVSTGPHTAIVTNYRPLTGSPTGGRELSEEYRLQIEPKEYFNTEGDIISTGWQIRVDNTGTVTSRNHLLLQIEYNRLEGPQDTSHPNLIGTETYVHHIDIGVLHNEAEANVKDDDDIVSYKIIDFNNTSAEYCSGIGEVSVKLKVITQSTANINFNDKLNSPEVLLANADIVRPVRIIPTLAWTVDCEDNTDNDNDIFVKGNQKQSNVTYEEGITFEINLINSGILPAGIPNASVFSKQISMTSDIGFKVEALVENAQGNFEVDQSWSPIRNQFKLEKPDRDAIEIIPVSSEGSTVVEKRLRISATKLDGSTLPETHWAYLYTSSEMSVQRSCTSASCCIDSLESFRPDQDINDSGKSITSILTNGDSDLLNNKDNAKFYTKKFNQNPYIGTRSTIAISWKNFRENTSFCYPPVSEGTTASFMTIYANEARVIADISQHNKNQDNESVFYDPRYTLMEVGATETLNGRLVRITVNSGSPVEGSPETCYIFKFNGSIAGTHYTLEELQHLDQDFDVRELTTNG